MTRDPHERCQEALALRLYGDAEPAETAFADAHLRECPACRDDAAALEATLGRLVHARAPSDGAGATATRDASNDATGAPVPRRRWLGRVSLVAASFAAGVVATLLVLRPTPRDERIEPSPGAELAAAPPREQAPFLRREPPPRAPTSGLFSEFRRS